MRVGDAADKESAMAKLTTKKRKALKGKDFVFPKTRKFPIEDKAHAAVAADLALLAAATVRPAPNP